MRPGPEFVRRQTHLAGALGRGKAALKRLFSGVLVAGIATSPATGLAQDIYTNYAPNTIGGMMQQAQVSSKATKRQEEVVLNAFANYLAALESGNRPTGRSANVLNDLPAPLPAAMNCVSDAAMCIEPGEKDAAKYGTVTKMMGMLLARFGDRLSEVMQDPVLQKLLSLGMRGESGKFVYGEDSFSGAASMLEKFAKDNGLEGEAKEIMKGAKAAPAEKAAEGRPAAPSLSEGEKAALEEKEKQKLEQKYRQAFKYFIELGINLDSIAKNPQRLDAYVSAYNGMTSEEQQGFRKYLEETLVKLMPALAELKARKAAGASEEEINNLMDKASGEVTREELNSLLKEMELGFNIELPEESEAGKGVDLSLTMEKMMRMYVEYSGASSGSDMFDMAGMLKGIEEARGAFNN